MLVRMNRQAMGRANGREKLRHGYTTGACATAAAKAATIALLTQTKIEQVEINLPVGWKVAFKIERCAFDDEKALCSIIKDGGDDPDATHGAEICATVSRCATPGITIEGGEGVGQVTKPGLGLPVGGPAINPVPRAMITSAVEEALGRETTAGGVQVVISVPKGVEIAKRTLNGRLGIVGGISILGTTGIVVPYSTEAFQASISQALDVAVAAGCKEIVLTTGGRSEKYAQRSLALPEEAFVQMGDFVGHALEESARRGITVVRIWGMVGKLCKMAGGYMQTHVSHSLLDPQLLGEIALACGARGEIAAEMRQANTARHLMEIASAAELRGVPGVICRLAANKCAEHVDRVLRVECVMTDDGGTILGRALSDE